MPTPVRLALARLIETVAPPAAVEIPVPGADVPRPLPELPAVVDLLVFEAARPRPVAGEERIDFEGMLTETVLVKPLVLVMRPFEITSVTLYETVSVAPYPPDRFPTPTLLTLTLVLPVETVAPLEAVEVAVVGVDVPLPLP